MKAFEEIIGKYYVKYPVHSTEGWEFTVQQVKDIAIAYAKICLEKAAKDARIDSYIRSNTKGSRYKRLKDNVEFDIYSTIQMFKINKKSIIDIELP